MNGRGRRNKGAAGERELAAILTDNLGVVVKRKLGQARDGGDDIQIERFRIEVKRHERLQIKEWCKQIEAASDPGDIPIVCFRQNGEPWRAVVPLDFLITAIREELSGEGYLRKGPASSAHDNGRALLHELPREPEV